MRRIDVRSDNGQDRLPDDVVSDDYFNVLHRAYEQMNAVFERLQREDDLTQERIARRLGVNKSLVSRRLHGGENLTLRAMSGMATAMHCVLDISFTPYKDLSLEAESGAAKPSSTAATAQPPQARLTLVEAEPAFDTRTPFGAVPIGAGTAHPRTVPSTFVPKRRAAA